MLVKPVAYYVENRLNQKMRYCIINPPSRRRGLSLIKMKNLTKTTTIQSAQYAQLLSVNNITLITSTLMAIILCYWQRNVTDSHVLMSWLALIVIINVVRIGIGFYYKKNPSSDINIIQKRLTTFRVGVISGSIIWGATSLFLFPANDLSLIHI